MTFSQTPEMRRTHILCCCCFFVLFIYFFFAGREIVPKRYFHIDMGFNDIRKRILFQALSGGNET